MSPSTREVGDQSITRNSYRAPQPRDMTRGSDIVSAPLVLSLHQVIKPVYVRNVRLRQQVKKVQSSLADSRSQCTVASRGASCDLYIYTYTYIYIVSFWTHIFS